MSLVTDTFARLKAKGVEAYRAGEYRSAAVYLGQAAEALVDLAAKAPTAAVREERKTLAAELIELAKEASSRAERNAPPPAAAPSGSRGAPAPGAKQKNKVGDDDESKAEDWIIKEKPSITFADVAGLEDVKTDIRLKMIYPFKHPELAAKYGIPRGGGVLLYGPPGTGKTMIAKAIAGEIEATYYCISPAQIMSKWVGEAENNIKKLFESAKENSPAIIFMDEIEALVPSRSKADGSTVMQRVIPQILQEIEGFDRKAERALLFLGATNMPWSLDSAMMRPGRLDTKIYVPLPDAPARMKLLELYFKNRPLGEDVDFGEVCDRLDGYSGADIKAIAQRAAAIPFLDAVGGAAERPITRADIDRIIADQPPSVRKDDLKRFEAFAEEN